MFAQNIMQYLFFKSCAFPSFLHISVKDSQLVCLHVHFKPQIYLVCCLSVLSIWQHLQKELRWRPNNTSVKKRLLKSITLNPKSTSIGISAKGEVTPPVCKLLSRSQQLAVTESKLWYNYTGDCNSARNGTY